MVEANRLFIYCMLAFNTLARPEAILALRRCQVDTQAPYPVESPRVTQSKKSRPTVAVTNTLPPRLKPGHCEVVIHWAGKPVCSLQTGWTALKRKAGLSGEVIPYTIRHTMATELRKRGIPAWEVSRMLGRRASEYTATGNYTHDAPDYLGAVAKAIDSCITELQ